MGTSIEYSPMIGSVVLGMWHVLRFTAGDGKSSPKWTFISAVPMRKCRSCYCATLRRMQASQWRHDMADTLLGIIGKHCEQEYMK